jgi:CHAP domain
MKSLIFVVAVPVLGFLVACGGPGGGSSGSQASVETSSRSIGASGGIILLPDGSSVSVPKGALTHDVTITIETNRSAPKVMGATSTGLTYLFGPEGQTFEVPVKVTLAIDPTLIPTGHTMQDVGVYTAPRDSATYVGMPATIVDSLHVSTMTSHFSNFTSAVSRMGSINPDNPMTDADMKGGQSITVAKMQSFLASKGSALAKYVDPDSHKTAAEEIVTASQGSGLSPVYMLARIQSESSLVTSGTLEYLDAATGCGCPSTCEQGFSGFHAQIQCAATQTAKYFSDAAKGEETVGGWKIGVAHTSEDKCRVTPANAATAALYTYTPYEGYDYSSVYCAGAEEMTHAGEEGLEVTGLAALFDEYAKDFPGSTSGTTDSPPCRGKSLGESIADLANANRDEGACSKNSLGGRGFSTPGAWGDSCTNNVCGGQDLPEFWCADFATWVWSRAGVEHTSELGAGAESFAKYGVNHHTSKQGNPEVGDAVVFNSGEHVAIVVKVDAGGYIETVSGDWGGDCVTSDSCECEANFSSTSHVVFNTPAYKGEVNQYSHTMEMTITAIVSPVGGSPTSCKGTSGTGGVTPPKSPSADDVCCATCTGQGAAYYAAEVRKSDGSLESCSDAAKDFCEYSFHGGVSSAELGSCPIYEVSSGSSGSGSSCKLDGHDYAINTCTETKQCDGSSWVTRSSDPSGCLSGIESKGACLSDSGSVVAENTCTSKLQCSAGVWIDREDDPALCNCELAGKSFASNTCTETLQCNDGAWIARDSDPSSCHTGIESAGDCLTDKGGVVPENTCTSTLQCNDGVWVERKDDASSCR